MKKQNLALFLVGLGLIWTSGAIAGSVFKENRDQKKFEDLDCAVCTLLSCYKDGVKFNEVDIEFLKEHGFDDKYMFR